MIKVIKHADVYAPQHRGLRDILICGETICAVEERIELTATGAPVEVIDLHGAAVGPGYLDGHVHVTGGGGEQGPASRVPECRVSELVSCGVTTVLGLLGTDCITRSLENLQAKTRALSQEGISAYMLTGSYRIPSPTLTGSVMDDIVFIDECSTVDNRAMKKLLENLSCDLLVLVGDIYQIQSVRFGNWFGLARYFLPEDVVYELKNPYRGKNPVLRELWHRVRTLDPTVSDFLTGKGFVCDINEDLFKKTAEDEIILCLNYDGLYGINNVNKFMQNDNPNPPIEWGTGIYKVDDPVIFDEYNMFYPVLYNNLKGKILHIEKSRTDIQFDVEVDCEISSLSAGSVGLELVGSSKNGKSVVRFTVNKFVDDDESEKQRKQVVPFQVAYAVSIHKAQGLEYDSVKVLITNESEERISHNIFYTAITRARQYLKIFWEYSTQEKVIKNMEILSYSRDASILSQRYSLKMNNKIKFG